MALTVLKVNHQISFYFKWSHVEKMNGMYIQKNVNNAPLLILFGVSKSFLFFGFIGNVTISHYCTYLYFISIFYLTQFCTVVKGIIFYWYHSFRSTRKMETCLILRASAPFSDPVVVIMIIMFLKMAVL